MRRIMRPEFEMDIEPLRYQTHEELRAYCWRVASAAVRERKEVEISWPSVWQVG
jgi:hypothetical protein